MGMGRGESTQELEEISLNASRQSDWKSAVRIGVSEVAESLGAQAYEVGGSIRDQLLDKESKDLDICLAGASAEELLSLLRSRGVSAEELIVADKLVGVRVSAPWTPRDGVEIAIARRESSTGPGHTEFAVDTGDGIKIEEDLLRRDFTVNAIAREILPGGRLGGLVDPLGGAADASALTLRQANPSALSEDPLRALRGLARVSKDGLWPDPETLEEMSRRAPDIQHLSSERVRAEFEKLLMGDDPKRALELGRQTGLLQAAIPELAPMIGFDQRSDYHSLSVDDHTFLAVQRSAEIGAPLTVRWAALFHDAGKPAAAFEGADGRLHYHDNKSDPEQMAHELVSEALAAEALDRLRLTSADQKKIRLLVREHMFGEGGELDKRSERRQAYKTRALIKRVGRDSIDELLLLRRCDRRAKYDGDPPSGWDSELSAFEDLVSRERHQPLTVRELVIGGDEIKSLGAEGPQIGEILRELNQRVLADPESNTEERLLSWAEKLASKSAPAR